MKENKMDKRYFSRKEMLALDGNHARLQAAAELFGDALDAEDEETLEALCKWASSCEEEAIFLPLGFQFSCLSWLTDYYQERWRGSEDGSAEEERSWEGLADCLWNFKWIVAHLPQDLLMDEEALESANNMMLAYYQAFELGLSAYHKVLMKQAMLRGDAEAAERHFQAWRGTETEDSEGSDCMACEQSSLVEYFHFIGDYENAVRYFEPIGDGDLECEEVPHITYFACIDSLIRLGRKDEAAELLDEALDLVSNEMGEYVRLLPQLIQLKNRLGLLQQAADLLAEYGDAIVAISENNPYHYLQYLLAVAPFQTEALAEAEKLAARFDQRNGNHFYQMQLAVEFHKQDTLH